MKNKCILDCMTLVGHTPSRFEGSKTYVSTGAVDCDHIAFEDTEQVTYTDRPSRANLAAEVGDILFAKMASTEKTLRITPENADFLYSTGFCAVRANDDVLLPECLYHLLSSEQFLLQKDKNSSGATQKAITNAGLAKIMVSIPPMEEQEELARKLDTIARLIVLRREELVELDNVVKSRFIELFGDPVANAMGWQTKPITAVCHKIFGGGTPSKSHPEYFTGSIPWVSPKDMKASVISDSIDHITEDAIAQSTTNLIPPNSVLMVIRSGILKHTLPVAINSVSVTINQDMKAFVPNSQVTAEYLLHYFKGIEADVLSGVRGVTADNIDFKTFQLREIIVPPIEMQNEFAAFVEQTDKSKYYSSLSFHSCHLAASNYRQEWMICRTLNF